MKIHFFVRTVNNIKPLNLTSLENVLLTGGCLIYSLVFKKLSLEYYAQRSHGLEKQDERKVYSS